MIKKIDHIVITTSNIEQCIGFYTCLGFAAKNSGERYELFAGDFKINVHRTGHELSPHAQHVQQGSADLCFEINGELCDIRAELLTKDITIEIDIVDRMGANGAMRSLYLRDPDGNLVELCSYL